MKHLPLKRHAALQPFSRDHTIGLIRAHDLLRTAQKEAKERLAGLQRFLGAWNDEIEAHFDDEERLLPALMNAAHRERLNREHDEIRSSVAELTGFSRKEPETRRMSLPARSRIPMCWCESQLQGVAAKEPPAAILKAEPGRIERSVLCVSLSPNNDQKDAVFFAHQRVSHRLGKNRRRTSGDGCSRLLGILRFQFDTSR